MSDYAVIGLIVTGIVLHLLSFFKRNKIDLLEQQVEELSLSIKQENYTIKRKLKLLQDELLISDLNPVAERLQETKPGKSSLNAPLVTQVIQLHEKGCHLSEIAKHVSMPTEEVQLILQQQKWGIR